MLVSIVVPVYNSTVVEELADRVDAVFAERGKEQYELIFVDDCSPNPAIWPSLERLAMRHPAVKALQLTRNFGGQAATLCGLKEARGDFVVTMDDDLQHLPEDIPNLLEKQDWDIVIGQYIHRQHNAYKRLVSRIKGVFDRIILGKPMNIQLTSFRMLSRTVVDGVLSMHTPYPIMAPLMFHVSRKITGVPVRHEKRKAGKSNYTLVRQIRLFSNLIINNSSLILRVVGYLGILCAIGSFLYAGWVVFQKLVYGYGRTGWPSVITTLLLVGGLLLFSIGIIGEYLIRIIETSEAKPMYFVRRRLGGAACPHVARIAGTVEEPARR